MLISIFLRSELASWPSLKTDYPNVAQAQRKTAFRRHIRSREPLPVPHTSQSSLRAYPLLLAAGGPCLHLAVDAGQIWRLARGRSGGVRGADAGSITPPDLATLISTLQLCPPSAGRPNLLPLLASASCPETQTSRRSPRPSKNSPLMCRSSASRATPSRSGSTFAATRRCRRPQYSRRNRRRRCGARSTGVSCRFCA